MAIMSRTVGRNPEPNRVPYSPQRRSERQARSQLSRERTISTPSPRSTVSSERSGGLRQNCVTHRDVLARAG
jgi:hypothetical protein